MDTVDLVKKRVDEFKSLQEQYRDYGAWDTEPDWHFQAILARAIRGEDPKIPNNAKEWELFDNMPGASNAARALCHKVDEIVQLIQNSPIKDQGKIREYLETFIWRVPI